VLLSYPAKTLILGGGFRNRRCWQNGWHANALSTIIYKPVADKYACLAGRRASHLRRSCAPDHSARNRMLGTFFNYFFLENIGFLQKGQQLSPRKFGNTYYVLIEGKKRRP
jgi:hypothetical protein